MLIRPIPPHAILNLWSKTSRLPLLQIQ